MLGQCEKARREEDGRGSRGAARRQLQDLKVEDRRFIPS